MNKYIYRSRRYNRKFENTKGASKDIQYNGQQKKSERTNNDLQTFHRKLKIEARILASLQWTTHHNALQDEFDDTKVSKHGELISAFFLSDNW